ncbi:hypothetical protein ACVGWW_00355, partial [Enterobacter hormaechei]
ASSAAKYLICSSLSRQISVTEASWVGATPQPGPHRPLQSATTFTYTKNNVVNFIFISRRTRAKKNQSLIKKNNTTTTKKKKTNTSTG